MKHRDWQSLRGFTGRYPCMWRCSRCGYWYWSHGETQDPDGDGHCSDGIWLADLEAIAL